MAGVRILDIEDEATLRLAPPCADPRFDHRTCDYWEDADRGSNASRPAWLERTRPNPPAQRRVAPDNPFAPPERQGTLNPFLRGEQPPGEPDAVASDPVYDLFRLDDDEEEPLENPFAPSRSRPRPVTTGAPRKLALLDRGRGVFGSYAKVMLVDEQPVGYTQFGPLSAYPRASRLRELYPQLPDVPLPAVITCISTTAEARRQRFAAQLVTAVCEDLAQRGFSAVEAYPDLTRSEDETSAGRPAFWHTVGFRTAVDDEHFPVMRRELD